MTGIRDLETTPAGTSHGRGSFWRGGIASALLRLRLMRTAVAGLTGWRRAAVSLGAGALGVLAMAPFFFVPILIVSFTLLVWLLDGARDRPLGEAMAWAARTVWLFSFGFLFPGLAWIGEAFLVDAETFAWLMPFAISLLPAGLSLFLAVLVAPSMVLWRPGAVSRVFLLAALWCLAEWLRGHVLTGFPWNLVGLTWVGFLPVAQAGAFVGSYGLSALTVAWAASFACLAEGAVGERRARPAWAPAAGMTVVLCGLTVMGLLRLGGADLTVVEGVTLRLVQPNTPQQERMVRENHDAIWGRLVTLTARDGAEGVSHVIWPESAPPGFLARNPRRLEELDAVLSDNQVLLTGALRAENDGTGGYRFYNGFYAIDGAARILASYDKRHLVPFGEYVPQKDLLARIGIGKVAQEVGGLSFGDQPRRLPVPGAPLAAPVICYEIIFPGAVVDAGPRPAWIINVTDDAWFGDSIGPRQHFAIARMRAIEEGLPVVRAANGGISAVIDPWGRVRARLDLHERGVLDSGLPIAAPATAYGRWKDVPVLAVLLGVVLMASIMRFTRP
ncbi:MAG: apolipoprotein N-acyltransferase [Alphaproteobacteria bacterium]